MSKITTALIGCGGRGPQGHAKVAQASGSLELVAVCDIDQRRAKSVGEKFGVEYVIDYHQLLTRMILSRLSLPLEPNNTVPLLSTQPVPRNIF